jgi:hypothetical protein
MTAPRLPAAAFAPIAGRGGGGPPTAGAGADARPTLG